MQTPPLPPRNYVIEAPKPVRPDQQTLASQRTQVTMTNISAGKKLSLLMSIGDRLSILSRFSLSVAGSTSGTISTRSGDYRATRRFPAFLPARESATTNGIGEEEALQRYKNTEEAKAYQEVGVPMPLSPEDMTNIRNLEAREVQMAQLKGKLRRVRLFIIILSFFCVLVGIVFLLFALNQFD